MNQQQLDEYLRKHLSRDEGHPVSGDFDDRVMQRVEQLPPHAVYGNRLGRVGLGFLIGAFFLTWGFVFWKVITSNVVTNILDGFFADTPFSMTDFLPFLVIGIIAYLLVARIVVGLVITLHREQLLNYTKRV